MEKKKTARSSQKNNNSALVKDDAKTLRRQGRGEIMSDVLGSYTGTGEHGEKPEQDADDL